MSRVRRDRPVPGSMLKPDTPPPAKPRKPINKVSRHKRARLAEQKAASSCSPVCEMPDRMRAVTGCTGRAVDDHHRRPQSLTSEQAGNLVRLCRACHRWVEEHPTEATRIGVSDIRPRFDPRSKETDHD